MNTSEYHEFELEDEIIIEEKDILVQTKAATQTDVEIVQTAEQEQVEFIKEEKTYEKFSTARGYWKNALKHLQHGNEDEARWALEQAIELDPKSKISHKLLNQIDADAINELGIEAFEYKVQYGDSLSMLSKTYLDDPLQFYLLAKYNDIENPSHLVVGRTINIPGKAPVILDEQKPEALAVVQEKPNLKTVEVEQKLELDVKYSNDVKMAEKHYQEKNYEQVVFVLEANLSLVESDKQVSDLLVASYYEIAKDQLKTGNIQEAKYLLLKASELQPDNPKINMALIDMDESSETEMLYEKGVNALADNKIVEAHDYMEEVLTLNPYHTRAMEKKKQIEVKLVPHYYKQALMAQRKHKLDDAIEYWDELLAIKDDDENARIYRNKAIALKMKLEKFAAE